MILTKMTPNGESEPTIPKKMAVVCSHGRKVVMEIQKKIQSGATESSLE